VVFGRENRMAEERDRWREEAWRCYVHSGADPDGADARHLNLGEAPRAVEELAKDYDEACAELDRYEVALREIGYPEIELTGASYGRVARAALEGNE